MESDQDPSQLRRNRRPLTEINKIPAGSRRIDGHSGRSLIRPDGSKIHVDHGCRSNPETHPVNRGIPAVATLKEEHIAADVLAIRSGNVPVRPSDGQLVRNVSVTKTYHDIEILLVIFFISFSSFLDTGGYTSWSSSW